MGLCTFILRSVHCCALVGAFTFLALQPTVAAEQPLPSLGTLFYTPTQRLEIVRTRQHSEGMESSTSTQLQGVVLRSNGKSTVWVNGKALAEGAPQTPKTRGVDAVVDGKRLRVGESLDTLSGARTDIVAPGAVTAGAKR